MSESDTTMPTEVNQEAKESSVDEQPKPGPGAGKVVLITGANSGIGYDSAQKFVRDGYEVILACRSEEKGNQSAETIRGNLKNANVQFMKLDLNSLASVRNFVKAFQDTGKKLNILVANAGVAHDFSGTQAKKTADGFEQTFGVNHLGHFLLVNSLAEQLKAAADADGEARVVVVASSLHNPNSAGARTEPPAHIDFDNLQLEAPNTYNGALAYKNSKLANVLFTYEFARRAEKMGITANCLCPGFIPTSGLMRNTSMGMFRKLMFQYFVMPMLRWNNVVKTIDEGGNMIMYVATDQNLKGVNGKYFRDFKEAESSEESNNEEVAKRLWDISKEMVKLDETI